MKQQFFILGCGKMGSALLNGWLSGGAAQDTDFIIIDPYFDKQVLAGQSQASLDAVSCYHHFADVGAARADIMLLSVKPQMMAQALGDMGALDLSDCCFISIAAGLGLAQLGEMIGHESARIIRSMPNTPAAIGKGMTALIGNAAATADDVALAETLLAVCGKVERLECEAQLDAVTALSGSGPAYVFLLAEAMARAGTKLGLGEALSQKLAEQTIYGAGALLSQSDEPAAILRENVTSKGGTTAAALAVLMADDGMVDLLERAMAQAHKRSQELGD